MYLAREGCKLNYFLREIYLSKYPSLFYIDIRPGTIAAKGVSATDMAKRQQNEIWKKQMLQNLHMFISRERLCVHNLPPNLSDKQLLQLFKKNSSKDAKITEV